VNQESQVYQVKMDNLVSKENQANLVSEDQGETTSSRSVQAKDHEERRATKEIRVNLVHQEHQDQKDLKESHVMISKEIQAS